MFAVDLVMKVLMVIPSYHPIIGGTQILVRKLATTLNIMGTHADVMTFNMNRKWSPVWREEIWKDEFKVFRIPVFNPFSTPTNPSGWLLRMRILTNSICKFENIASEPATRVSNTFA